MPRLVLLLVLLVGAALGGISTAAPDAPSRPQWVITALRVPAQDSAAIALNDRGQVIGSGATKDEQFAFVWQNGKVAKLPGLGGRSSFPTAINSHGKIVGCSDTRSRDTHAVLWRDGEVFDLGTLGGAESCASSINDRGEIVGYAEIPSSALPAVSVADASKHAFLWRNGQMTDLGSLGGGSRAVAINEQGQVIGESRTTDDHATRHAVLWENGKMISLTRQRGSSASVINDQGQIAGWSARASDYFTGNGHVTLWQNGKMVDLGTLGGRHSYPNDINEKGQVVGSSKVRVGSTKMHAFLWQNGRMIDLGTPAGDVSYGEAINGRGEIVMNVSSRAGHRVWLWQNGTAIALPTLGGSSDATAINDSGIVVGDSGSKAVVWTPADG